MLNVTRMLLLVVALGSVGCRVGHEAGSAENSGAAARPVRTNADWEKMRQCYEQADLFAKRQVWQGDGVGWGSHYNSEQERCFVLYTKFDPQRMLVFEELYDAFEGTELGDSIIESRGSKRTLCNTTAHPWTEPLARIDCAEYTKMLLERMEK